LLLLNRLPSFTVVHLAFVLLGIIIVWLVVAFLTARAYPRALTAALARRRLTGVAVTLDDSDSVRVLTETLRNPRPGAALYALGLLAEGRPEALAEALPDLLAHPAPVVRREALGHIERNGLADPRAVAAAAEGDPDPAVRGAAWRALAAVGGPEAETALLARLCDAAPETRLGALVGLRRHGAPAARAQADAALASLVASADRAERLLAVRVLEAPAGEECDLLARLLNDADAEVRRAALTAAGRSSCAAVWPLVVAALEQRATQTAAVGALIAGGEAALPTIRAAFGRADLPREMGVGLARAAGRIGGERAVTVLAGQIAQPNDTLRTELLLALAHAGYRAEGGAADVVRRQIAAETARAAGLLAGLRDCLAVEELAYLRRVLDGQFVAARDRIYLLLSFLFDPAAMRDVREVLGRGQHASDARRAYALEILDLRLPADLKALVMPLSEELPAATRLQRLGAAYDLPALPATERVAEMTRGDDRAGGWLRATQLFAVGQLQCSDPDLPDLLARYRTDADPVVRETADWTAARLGLAPANTLTGERPMLTTIEKVILLKDADLFAETPDELLAEVAGLLTEVELPAGQAVFQKSEPGDSLYIVVSGRVRVHDGDYTLNVLGESEMFGEMALLEPEPRMASVTAETDALLLRLDGEPFFELIDTRSEVARGIIRVLSRRLRQRVQEVAALRAV
jgi:hypothetical protein